MKYLVKRIFIVSKEAFNLVLCFLGKKSMKFSKILFPSFKRKKVINKTERMPILKLPICEIIELKS